ncbi:MAG: tetratricopeptide repeat protein [Candidatus Thiodiazotropha sp.]
MHVKRGEIDKALPILQRAVSKGTGFPDIDYHLGFAYFQQGQLESARQHINTALAAEQPFDGIEEARALLAKIR